MANPLSSEPGKRHLEEICKLFKEKPVVERIGKFILFVCGGKTGAAESSLRKEFLNWAKTELNEFVCILAEEALSDSFVGEGREFVNLAKFESVMADISDGVLIFPESVGSYAELGYFSHSVISKKTFVANLYDYQASESFLNLGPIDSIGIDTFLKPVILKQSEGKTDFEPIKERLQNRIKLPEYHRTVPYLKFSKFNFKQKLLVTFELLRILRLADLATIRYAIAKCFHSNPSRREVTHLLRILLAAKYIRRRNEYFAPVPGILLIEIKNTEIDTVLARSRFLYEKSSPEVSLALSTEQLNAD